MPRKIFKEANRVQTVPATKKVCFFCKATDENFKNPIYTDVLTLRKFVTDRGKIVGKARSGLCAKHQRKFTKQVKYARHLALLPFTLQA